MSTQHARPFSRRRFLGGLTLAGTAGLLGLHPRPVAAEPPPETTTAQAGPGPRHLCGAPVCGRGAAAGRRVHRGAVRQSDGGVDRSRKPGLRRGRPQPALRRGRSSSRLDAGDPLVLLAGVHVGCFELFGTSGSARSATSRGRRVAVPSWARPAHVFLASMVAYVGLDPSKDITLGHRIPPTRVHAAPRRGQDRCLHGLSARAAGTAGEADRARGGQQRGGPALVAVFLLHGRRQPGVRPEAPGGHQAGAARDPEGDRPLCPRAGAGRPVPRGQGLHDAATTMPSRRMQGDPLRPVARVRPRGHRALLRPAPPRGRDDQEQPPEAHRPGHRLALPQRAEEGVEGIEGGGPWSRRVSTVSLPSPAPNQGVQATASSVRSSLAPASSRA